MDCSEVSIYRLLTVVYFVISSFSFRSLNMIELDLSDKRRRNGVGYFVPDPLPPPPAQASRRGIPYVLYFVLRCYEHLGNFGSLTRFHQSPCFLLLKPGYVEALIVFGR